LRAALLKLIEALFKVLLFTYDCEGVEHVPRQGAAVIAANHPSYLDPVLLSLRVRRPIRFMAWEGLFKVPALGFLLRSFGAFPVDTRRGKGREAYEKAKALVTAGKLVGIFPEGHRSRAGWLEMGLKEGAARLVWETGAPLVPATITGAFRAWPHYQSLPKPAKIKVRFHERIDPAPYRSQPEDVALPALLQELRRRVERSLDPGVKADLRRNLLWRGPSPWPRLFEVVPPLALAVLVFWKTRSLASVLPAYAFIGYLLLDHFLIPQRRLSKWVRNGSPVLFVLGYGPMALQALGLPAPLGGAALAATVLGAGFPYLYERSVTALDWVRGLVLAACLELGVQYLAPSGLGPSVALPLFAAAFAWERRSVFWRYATPLLLAYVLVVYWNLGGSSLLLLHAVAGLLACLLLRLLPLRARAQPVEEPTTPGLGLNL
jgi:1-acyl-sn-glycerol-3-phosphate acyltransferase